MNDIPILEKKMKSLVPMKGVETTIYAAVFLLVSMGVAQSISFGSWQHLERSGSLIIITGVLVAYYDYVSLLGDMRVFYRTKFKKLLSEMESSKPKGIISGVMHDGKIDDTNTKAKEIDRLLVLARKRVNTIEATIIILGTFISGYGILIGKLLGGYNA